MNKTNKIIQITTISAILLICNAVIVMEKALANNQPDKALMDDLPRSIQPDRQNHPLSNTDANLLATPTTVEVEAQKPLTLPQAIELASRRNRNLQEAQPDKALMDDLPRSIQPDRQNRPLSNADANLLATPTTVEVEAQKPLTLPQAIELASRRNRNLQEAQPDKTLKDDLPVSIQPDRQNRPLSNADANLLATPTTVEVEAQKPLTLPQAIELASRRNRNLQEAQPDKTLKDDLPRSIQPDPQKRPLSNSDAVFLELISGEVAQAAESTPDATADIIKPAQESIPSTEKLNPNPDPLSLPNKVEAVEVGKQQPISLEQAIELAFKNNRNIKDAQLDVERSQEVLRENQAAWFPTLSLGSGLTYSDSGFLDSVIDQNIDEQVEEAIEENPGLDEADVRSQIEDQFTNSSSTSFNFNADLTLNYTLYNGGQRGAAIRAAEKQLRSDELNLEVITEQTRLDTASDYYDLQDSDAQVKIEEAAVEDAQQTLKDAQLLERAGLGTRFDVLRAEVELAQARQRLNTAMANQNIARRQLAQTLSVSQKSDLSTADAIAEAGTWEFSLPESIIQAFDNRAELQQQLLAREISEEQRTIALSAIRPSLAANASYGYDDDFEDDFDISDNYQLGLNLQWNFFDGGAARAAARQSEKDIAIADNQFADQRNLIRFAVEQAFFGLKSNQSNITTATKEVELAEESLRLARLRFQAGVGTQTDVIDAQTQLTTARGNLLSSIIDYNQSYTDLQRQVSKVADLSEGSNSEGSEPESIEPESIEPESIEPESIEE